jgi:hypothetical protein
MSPVEGTKWRFLVVEDNDGIARQLIEAIPDFVSPPDTANGVHYRSFKDAIKHLDDEKYDILILDLKDDDLAGDDEADAPSGLKVFEKLKRTRFAPVVFYTALAHKVRAEQTSFVRVVEKTETIVRVKEEVNRVFATQLPILLRRVEDVQREYMWDFVSTHWQEFEQPANQADIAYLLARRLAISLEMAAANLAVTIGGQAQAPADDRKAHPMVMYIRPPIGLHRMAGDILVEKVQGGDLYWMILTPSCDFAQEKAQYAVLAKCEKLSGQDELVKWMGNQGDKNAKSRLEDLIGDNRKTAPTGPKLQPERFKFLPGTFFLPDLLVDFQQIRTVAMAELDKFIAIASLDSPFAEAILARFSRYFGRLGTPDVDKQVVLNRLQTAPQEETNGTPVKTPSSQDRSDTQRKDDQKSR